MSNNFTLNIYPNNLTEMRKKRGLTLKELAKCAGVGESTMYNMKNEKWGSEIKAKNAERIARALGVKPQEVFPDYARAKKEYANKIKREKERIFNSIEERDAAIEKTYYLAVYIAKKNKWRIEQCRNTVMDIEDLIGEALLELVETAEKVRREGIKKNMEFSKYAGHAMEFRFKSMQGNLMRQKRTACINVSLDAAVPGAETTYRDYAESLIPQTNSPEEIAILRSECREAALLLTQEQRREPEILELVRQIAI